MMGSKLVRRVIPPGLAVALIVVGLVVVPLVAYRIGALTPSLSDTEMEVFELVARKQVSFVASVSGDKVLEISLDALKSGRISASLVNAKSNREALLRVDHLSLEKKPDGDWRALVVSRLWRDGSERMQSFSTFIVEADLSVVSFEGTTGF